MRGDEHHGWRTGRVAQHLRQGQAIGPRHADVQQHKVKSMAAQELKSLRRIGGFAVQADGGRFAVAQQCAQPRAGQGFIIDNQNAQHHG